MKTMRYTRLIVIIFLISFSLIITPQFTNVVSAAFPITLADWDDVAAGLDDGTSGFFTFKHMGDANYFETSTDNDLSALNSFKVKTECSGGVRKYGTGYWNLTSSYSYIGSINFSFYAQDNGAGNWVQISFYNGTTTPIIMRFELRDGGFDTFEWNELTTWKTIKTSGIVNARLYIVITHNGTNHFNIKLLDSTFAVLANADYAGYIAADFTTFTHIYFSTSMPETNGYYGAMYFDDIIIDTTWSGTGTPPAGYLSVNAFDEVTGTNITDFNMVAVNQVGDTFFDYNLNNTYVVSGVLLPQGETTITISALNYYPRSYMVDIESGYFVINGTTYDTVTINAYLAHVNVSKLYFFQVVDEVSDGMLNPVEDVRVVIKGLCANTSYETVSDLQTDSYGYTMSYLIPGRNYQFTISKTGYITKTEKWIPDATYFGLAYPKVFKITLNPPNAIYLWSDYITFTGSLNNATSILYVYYTDALTNTTDWQLFIYRIDPNSTTPTLVASWSGTNDSFALSKNVTDSTDDYKVVFHVNHTNFNYNVIELYFFGYHQGITSATRFNLLFTLNYGYNPFGWANTFMFFVILGCFFSFGRSATYMSVFAIGLLLLFVNIFVGIETVWSALAGGAFPIILIFFGILMLIRDRGSLGVS